MEKTCLVVAAFIAAHASSASAATFVQTFVLPGSNGAVTGTDFDPSLGTLTSIDFTIFTERSYSFTAQALPTAPGLVDTIFQYTLSYALNRITGNSNIQARRPTTVVPANTTISFTGLISTPRGLSISRPDSVQLFQSGLVPIFEYRIGDPFGDVSFNSGLASYSESFGPLSATGALAYNYIPVVGPAVPEPATWAMMIAGFGLVGGAMRRRVASASVVC